MDTVTQQNAELVQQATTAAQSMQEQATSLAQLVTYSVSARSKKALRQPVRGVPSTPSVPLARATPARRRLAVVSR
jgi:methyl-accepting chemotaxis protein